MKKKKIYNISSDLANGYAMIEESKRIGLYKFIGIIVLVMSLLIFEAFVLSSLSKEFDIWSKAIAQLYLEN